MANKKKSHKVWAQQNLAATQDLSYVKHTVIYSMQIFISKYSRQEARHLILCCEADCMSLSYLSQSQLFDRICVKGDNNAFSSQRLFKFTLN